jgi:WD40 repeat protein
VAFSPSGHILAGGNEDGAIYLWDVAHPADPAALGPPLAIADQVSSLTFSPDGRTLAANSNRGFSNLGPFDGVGTICLWGISDPARPSGRTQFAIAPAPGFCSIAFSPDGHTLAGGSDGGTGNSSGSVQLWDITNPTRPPALGQPAHPLTTTRDARPAHA